VNYLLLFLLSYFLGGAGAAVGATVIGGLGRGAAIGGGILVGAPLVAAAAWLAVRWKWIGRHQRFWTIVGGVLGFGLALLVTLSTLSTPTGPLLGASLIGAGAVLGALMGKSAHDDQNC
jgi:hypothetical protein